MEKNVSTPIGPLAYWQKYGRSQHMLDMLAAAGTTYGYWKHICNGRKRPSIELAIRLVDASDRELDLLQLLGIEPHYVSAATGQPQVATGIASKRLRGQQPGAHRKGAQ